MLGLLSSSWTFLLCTVDSLMLMIGSAEKCMYREC